MTQKTRLRIMLACTGAIVASAGAPALAQVAPPPPAEAPEAEQTETTPQPQEQQGVTVRAQRRGQPAQRPQPAGDGKPVRKNVAAPRIPFRTMVVRDEETGRVIRLTRPYALSALANNPTIADNKRDVVMPVVFERHLRQEERILQNLDLYLGFEFGMHREMNLGDIEQLQRITRQLKPLTEDGDIATDLEDAGVFSPSQRAMNNMIVQDYQRAVSEEIKLETGREIGPMFLQIVEDALVEPRFAYGLMVIELIKHGPDTVAKAGLQDADGIDDVVALLQQGWPEDNASRGDMVGDVKSALSGLTHDDQEKLLRASREMREDPNVPSMPEVPLSVGGVVGMTDSNTGFKFKRYDSEGNLVHEHDSGGSANDAEQNDEDSDG
ncbi:MAG: hypothetical protein DHS20C14_15650 [Phycisphaeraceae bacterium]|nr:MAG: hypothetical protein DHS20C14_15650 [Phycisphaeraceae bacterium]